VLEDPTNKRFDNATIEEGVRLALDLLDQHQPNIAVCTLTLSSGGRDQPVSCLGGCMYLVAVALDRSGSGSRELEPESAFSYAFRDGVPMLHFSGKIIPRSGDVLRITYAASHRLSGLDAAVTTTLPDAAVSALVNGAAAQACLLRAGLLAETYGARPEETVRLLELSRLLLERFEQGLSQLKTLQEFGFPPGFALDADDRQTGRG
jgi:hypothetical protein